MTKVTNEHQNQNFLITILVRKKTKVQHHDGLIIELVDRATQVLFSFLCYNTNLS